MRRDKFSLADILAFLFSLIFIVAASVVSFHRYHQYEIFFYDFGIFDQAIWRVSRFKAPIIDHLVVGGRWIFADHFNPSIFLLSPLYWFTSRSEIILISQAVIVGLSGWVLYRIGVTVLNDRLLSLSILVAYFLFVGLQNAVITDFHGVTVMILPLILTFWALVKKRVWWYFLFLLLTLGFKESTFLVGIGVGILTLLIRREWLKIGLITIFLSLAWGFFSIKVIIPLFAGRPYQYSPSLSSNILRNMLSLVNHPIKRRTLFFSFLTFGFLPLFYPPSWPLILQDFFVRFVPQNSFLRWDLGLHYSAQIAPILGFSSIMALSFLKKNPWVLKFLSLIAFLIIVNALILHQFVLHGPLALAYNSAFYSHTKEFDFLDKLIEQVPKEASVMAQNNLAVRFTHQKVWLLRDRYRDFKPDYIIIDAREGQNVNNFFGIKDGDILSLLTKLKRDSDYPITYQTKEQYVFKRKLIKDK